jgi:hypothetical protein
MIRRVVKKAVIDHVEKTIALDGEEFPYALDEAGPSVVSYPDWDVLSVPIVVLEGIEVRR